MFKLTFYLLVAFLVFTVCIKHGNCAVAIEKRHPNAGPNNCLSEIHGLDMKAGEEKLVPGKCMKAMCKNNGDISYYSCGAVGVPEGYKLVPADPSLPYPKCCSTNFVPVNQV